jgi:RNA polymerase sigma-70 factor (ECF subfamily)
MGIPTNYPGLTPEMVKLIKIRAYALSRGYGHIPEDREDLEQDMALQLLTALPAHDPEKSSLQTFANRVIDYWTSVQVRKWRASCRDYRARGVSLDHICQDNDGERTTLGDSLREEEALGFTESLGCIEAVDLKVLVDKVLATLSPQLRTMCLALMNHSVADLCRSHNLSRGKVAFQMKKLRKAFEQVGLDESLRKKIRQNPRVSIM